MQVIVGMVLLIASPPATSGTPMQVIRNACVDGSREMNVSLSGVEPRLSVCAFRGSAAHDKYSRANMQSHVVLFVFPCIGIRCLHTAWQQKQDFIL